MKETIGILGGSFNPVHIGHIKLARYLSAQHYVDKVWLTLSPLNPLKDAADLVCDTDRLAMLKTASKGEPGVEVCDIELSMPRPSYTIDTLDELARRHPDKHFKLIIGSDNWLIFDRWREPRRILDDYGVIVYPRPGYDVTDDTLRPGMTLADAPVADISSTAIRDAIAKGEDIDTYLPHGVYNYINDKNLYR